MLVSRKAVLPPGSSSVHLSLPPHSAIAPVAHRDSLVTTQLGCHLILQDNKVKQNGRVTDMYMAYTHLQGIYVFFKSKRKTHTTTLNHSAVSANTIFGNVQLHPYHSPQQASLQQCSSISPKLCSQLSPALCLSPDLICWHPMSFPIPYTSSLTHCLPMSLTCLWPTDQT